MLFPHPFSYLRQKTQRTDALTEDNALAETMDVLFRNHSDIPKSIWFTVLDGVVTLYGEASSPMQRNEAIAVAIRIPGVKRVKSDVRIVA